MGMASLLKAFKCRVGVAESGHQLGKLLREGQEKETRGPRRVSGKVVGGRCRGEGDSKQPDSTGARGPHPAHHQGPHHTQETSARCH